MNALRNEIERDAHGDGTRRLVVYHPDQVKPALFLTYQECHKQLQHSAVEITIKSRSPHLANQRKTLNAICGDLAKQVPWPVPQPDGEIAMELLSKDDWRHMMVAAYRKDCRTVPGINGGFVVLGASSKDLNRRQYDDVIEMARAFGSERKVRWTPSKQELRLLDAR